MNKAQIVAAKSVERALNKAGRVGLTGGVFDSKFCLWPGNCEDIPPGREFFDLIYKKGMVLHTPDIFLDGGAGV